MIKENTGQLSADMQFDAIITDVRVDSVKQLYEKIAHICSSTCEIDEEDVIAKFVNASQDTISALGNGIAFPNFQSDKVSQDVTILMKLQDSVEMDTVDSEPVELVVMIISPEQNGSYHLQRLSRIVRMFNDKGMRDNLKSASTLDELHAILHYQKLSQEAA